MNVNNFDTFVTTHINMSLSREVLLWFADIAPAQHALILRKAFELFYRTCTKELIERYKENCKRYFPFFLKTSLSETDSKLGGLILYDDSNNRIHKYALELMNGNEFTNMH